MSSEFPEVDTQTELNHLSGVDVHLQTESPVPTEQAHEATLYAEPLLTTPLGTITNSLLTTWLAVLILIFLGIWVRRSMSTIPQGIQNIFEIILEQALSLADQVTGQRYLSEKVLPIALVVFLFVLINNWIGILPGVGSIGFTALKDGHEIFVPILRGGTADINTTLALGLIAVVGANIFGILVLGIWKVLNKYINIDILVGMIRKARKDPTLLIVAPITFFVGIIEMIGEVAKVASLSFRLFGNVFAGEVLLASMSALLAYGIPIPFLFLEVFIGLIQALIFGMLTLVYFTIATYDHADGEGAHGEQSNVVPDDQVMKPA